MRSMRVRSASILVCDHAQWFLWWFFPLEILYLVNTNRIGTTYSCVANYEGSNVEIIANEQGNFTTPSFVSFTDKERLIGESAKNQAAMNPRNTVFDIKSVLLVHIFFQHGWVNIMQALDWTSIRRPYRQERYRIMAFQGRRPRWEPYGRSRIPWRS